MSFRAPPHELVDDMLAAIDRIIERIGVTSADALAEDRNLLDVVCWNFMQLGEAAAQMDQQILEAHHEIPWRRATDLRNRIVHGYRSIDAAVLWDTTRTDLPPLRAALVALRETLAAQ